MPSLPDTSAVFQLIRCDLLDLALKTLKVKDSDVELLGETYSKAENNKDSLGRPILTAAQRDACLNFCKRVGRIKYPWANAAENIALTKKRDDLWHEGRRVAVDGGEAQIFGYTHKLTNFTIWTADNKCLIALAKIEECKHIHKRVIGRVYCLERILRELIEDAGFDQIAPKVVGCNREITNAISKGKGRCRELLLQAEEQLQKHCGGLLMS